MDGGACPRAPAQPAERRDTAQGAGEESERGAADHGVREEWAKLRNREVPARDSHPSTSSHPAAELDVEKNDERCRQRVRNIARGPGERKVETERHREHEADQRLDAVKRHESDENSHGNRRRRSLGTELAAAQTAPSVAQRLTHALAARCRGRHCDRRFGGGGLRSRHANPSCFLGRGDACFVWSLAMTPRRFVPLLIVAWSLLSTHALAASPANRGGRRVVWTEIRVVARQKRPELERF